MKAIQFSEAGAANKVLKEVTMDTQAPGPDDVRVRVAYAAVNPTDAKRRSSGRELGSFSPIVTGNDGAGVIEAVGANVDPAMIGKNVWIFGAQAGRPMGTTAEYCTLPVWMAPLLPDNASLLEGACLGVPAVTAYYSIYSDGPVEGKTVMVSGGGGRVGSYAVQMAKLGGANVIALVGTAENEAYVKTLGADHVINYRNDDVVARVMEITDGRGLDHLSEVAFGANVALFPEIMAQRGVITAYSSDAVEQPVLPFLPLMFKNVTMRPFTIYSLGKETQCQVFQAINTMLARGQLQHRVSAKHPFTLGGVIAAHEMIEANKSAGVCIIEVGG
ncbi:MAG: NADPH:quinone reductase [Rhodospirillales bacterium]